MNQLPPKEKATILSDTAFLSARALYFQSQRRIDECLADYREALSLSPQDSDLQQGYLWALISGKKFGALEQALRRGHGKAMKDPAYWGVFGAAYLSIGEPQKALPFFVKQAKTKNDYLWRLAYADALDQAGMPDPAWTLRRQNWTEMRKIPDKDLIANPEARDRVISLALQFGPADTGRRMLANLIQDRDLKQALRRRSASRGPSKAVTSLNILGPNSAAIVSAQALGESIRITLLNLQVSSVENSIEDRDQSAGERASASELALSYLLSNEGFVSARAWLLTRNANSLAKPAWARLSIALATQDKAEMMKLLDDLPDWLPRYDRVEAMKALGRTAAAQTSAFETLEKRPDNFQAYQSFLSTVNDDVTRVDVANIHQRFADLTVRETSVSAKWRIDQRWLVHADLAKGQMAWDPAPGNLASVLPKGTSWLQFGAKAVIDKGYLAVDLARYTMLRDFSSLQFEWQGNFERTWSVNTKLGHHVPATETPALKVGGYKDTFEARLSHQLTGRDRLTASLGMNRYATQDNTALGSSLSFTAGCIHQIEKLRPGVSFNVELSHSKFKRSEGADAVTALMTPAGTAKASEFFATELHPIQCVF